MLCYLYGYVPELTIWFLDNQVVYYFLGKTISSVLNIAQLPLTLCLGLRPYEPSPIHISIPIVVLSVHQDLGSHFGKIVWV